MPPKKTQKDPLILALKFLDQATHALTEARQLLGSIRPEAATNGNPSEAETPVPEWREKDYL